MPEYIEGKFGTALDFGGPEGGDWLQMDAPVVVDTVDFSIGLWMKPAKPQNCWGNVISSRDQDGGDAGIAIAKSGCLDNWYRVIIGGVIYWDGVGNPRNTVRPKALEWNHVVFVRQGREGSGISTGNRTAQNGADSTLTWVQSAPWDDPEKISALQPPNSMKAGPIEELLTKHIYSKER